jgi:hypothetical protein
MMRFHPDIASWFCHSRSWPVDRPKVTARILKWFEHDFVVGGQSPEEMMAQWNEQSG